MVQHRGAAGVQFGAGQRWPAALILVTVPSGSVIAMLHRAAARTGTATNSTPAATSISTSWWPSPPPTGSTARNGRRARPAHG